MSDGDAAPHDGAQSETVRPTHPTGPGWYQVGGDPYFQAYWNEQGWSAYARWDGSSWIDVMPEPPRAQSLTDGYTQPESRDEIELAMPTELAAKTRRRRERRVRPSPPVAAVSSPAQAMVTDGKSSVERQPDTSVDTEIETRTHQKSLSRVERLRTGAGSIDGVGAALVISSDQITIRHKRKKAVLAMGEQATVSFTVDNIGSLLIRTPKWSSPGFVTFILRHSETEPQPGRSDAALRDDPYTVIIPVPSKKELDAFLSYMRERVAKLEVLEDGHELEKRRLEAHQRQLSDVQRIVGNEDSIVAEGPWTEGDMPHLSIPVVADVLHAENSFDDNTLVLGIKAASGALEETLADWRRNLQDAEKRFDEAKKRREKRLGPFRKKVEQAKTKRVIASIWPTVKLFEDSITVKGKSHALNAQVEATVDTAGNLSHTRRHTLTRFALIGAFSVFTPRDTKHDDRELFILIEAPDWAEVVRVDKTAQLKARKLVQEINLASRQVDQSRSRRRESISSAQKGLDQAIADDSDIAGPTQAVLSAFAKQEEIVAAYSRMVELLQLRPTQDRVTKKANSLLERSHGVLSSTHPLASRAEQTSAEVERRLQLLCSLHAAITQLLQEKTSSTQDSAVMPERNDRPKDPGSSERAQSGVESNTGETPHDVFDQIARLGELHAQGLITEEQFERKRQELLDRI
jgi:hypothetical protein